jgi:hypothetical protein
VCPLRRRHGQCTGRQGRHDRVPEQRDLMEWVQIVSFQSVALAKSQISGSLPGCSPDRSSSRFSLVFKFGQILDARSSFFFHRPGVATNPLPGYPAATGDGMLLDPRLFQPVLCTYAYVRMQKLP